MEWSWREELPEAFVVSLVGVMIYFLWLSRFINVVDFIAFFPVTYIICKGNLEEAKKRRLWALTLAVLSTGLFLAVGQLWSGGIASIVLASSLGVAMASMAVLTKETVAQAH